MTHRMLEIPGYRLHKRLGKGGMAEVYLATQLSLDREVAVKVLLRTEVPNAMPLIVGGLRTATLQVVATATVAAYASLGGLGRFLIDGIKVRQFYLALVGALLVAALALALDAALALAVRVSRPGPAGVAIVTAKPGLRRLR